MPTTTPAAFAPRAHSLFVERTCFVATAIGVAVARDLCGKAAHPVIPFPAPPRPESRRIDEASYQPKWDRERRQIRVGEHIVKEFKLPAPNQETILTAFEEEGWPPRIDDPLPPVPDLDPRRRLHDTIQALNRKQRQDLLRFMGDGSGEGDPLGATDSTGHCAMPRLAEPTCVSR